MYFNSNYSFFIIAPGQQVMHSVLGLLKLNVTKLRKFEMNMSMDHLVFEMTRRQMNLDSMV